MFYLVDGGRTNFSLVAGCFTGDCDVRVQIFAGSLPGLLRYRGVGDDRVSSLRLPYFW